MARDPVNDPNPAPVRRLRVKPSAVVARVRAITAHPANAPHRLRSLGRVARCELQARATGKPVTVSIGAHSRIAAHLHAGGSWRAVLANPPDWNEMQAWRRHLRAGDLFVDVGAHAGVYTLWALDLGCEVVAVEPILALVEQLRANLALNGYRAEVHRLALAAEAGTMTMSGPDLLRQHLSIAAGEPDSGPDGAPASAGETVEVSTLDAIVGERAVAGVKIDVEGAERLVLEGASRALGEQRVGLLQLEWNDCSQSLLGETRAPVVALLREHGYALCRPDARGDLVPADGAAYGADLFARPA
jgi:FkbM family methyltransferase